MKKVMNKIFLSFAFALAFVFAAAVQVGAVDYTPKNNVKVSEGENGPVYKVVLQGGVLEKETLYVVGSSDTSLKLKYITNNHGSYAYTSSISVVKCSRPGLNNQCAAWAAYSPSVNVDQLRSSGYELPLNGFSINSSGANNQNVTTVSGMVNGTDLSTLNSNYGVENVTYVIIDYVAVKEYWKLFVGTVREVVAAHTEVIKVLDLTEIGGYVGISSVVNGNTYNATVHASVPVKQIKYFSTTQDIDFIDHASNSGKNLVDAFAELSANETVVAVTPGNTPMESTDANRKGLVFESTFTVTGEAGKHYYVLAVDEVGNAGIYDISVQGTLSGPTNPSGAAPSGNNVVDTNVGKIILVVLVGVLVLAAVLVIVQKIVDHKRKLY